VCNESTELSKLLHYISVNKDKNDEIIVLQDITEHHQDVENVLSDYKNQIILIKNKLNGNFSKFKNNLADAASGDYLFQIDADEIPGRYLFNSLKRILYKRHDSDCFLLPRLNTVKGITHYDIQKFNFAVNHKGYINFPDYQARIFRLNKGIKWVNEVHEELVGWKKLHYLPQEDKYCLIHKKDIYRQKKQDELYNSIIKSRNTKDLI
jgi:glycosyltransferase involved in cell wall biosynthesis